MAQLVVQTAFLGDVLLSIPLLKRVKYLYPESELHLVCRRGFGSLFLSLDLVDRVFEVDKSSSKDTKRFGAKLREITYDNIFCPHQSFRSALLVRRLHKKQAIGFRAWWNSWAFQKRIERPMFLPDALRQMSLLQVVDEELNQEFKKIYDDVSFHITPGNNEEIVVWEESTIPSWATMNCEIPDNPKIKGENIIFLSPGSVWETKKWRKDYYCQLGIILQKRGYQIVLLGSPDEMKLCREIGDPIPESINLAGRTSLLDSLQWMKKGVAMICNDSGAMHLAAMAQLPTISIFGPTVLEFGYRPWQNKAVVTQKALDCRPCGLHGAKKCPLGTHDCMKLVAVNQVLKSLDRLLSL